VRILAHFHPCGKYRRPDVKCQEQFRVVGWSEIFICFGGYQVNEKWLKDCKGKGLSSEGVAHYTKVLTAIAETINIQKSLDELFAEVEANLLEVTL
jgi:protein-arginine kinase activator protein McsA